MLQQYPTHLTQWDSMLSYYASMLKYPIPKETRVALAKLYYHVCTIPGLSTQMVATASDAFKMLTKSKKYITIDDLRLPWKPVYDILSQDLFLRRRQFEYTYVAVAI